MKLNTTRLRHFAVAAGSLAITLAGANAAPDDVYNPNDLLLFFQNPTGSVGNNQLFLYSLGSTTGVFRNAATPGDPTLGTTIGLGNINSGLTTAFDANWTSLSSSIFAGAVGQNASTNAAASTFSNGDFARTVYITRPRNGAGVAGQANSSTNSYPAANTGVPSAIAVANLASMEVPSGSGTFVGSRQVVNTGTTIDDQNPFSPTPTTPGTAYGAIAGGVQGAISSTPYSLGSINNIVLGLDLYRATPTTGSDVRNWHVANSIQGGSIASGTRSDFLGTVTISSNGDVNFVAVPEPTTFAMLALAGVAGLATSRRRRA